jgi:hypothetical protein
VAIAADAAEIAVIAAIAIVARGNTAEVENTAGAARIGAENLVRHASKAKPRNRRNRVHRRISNSGRVIHANALEQSSAFLFHRLTSFFTLRRVGDDEPRACYFPPSRISFPVSAEA